MTPDEESLTDDQLAALYVEFVPVVAGRVCRRPWLADEAESVCNGALAEAVRLRHRSRPGCRFYHWFACVARWQFVEYLRADRVRRRAESARRPAPVPVPGGAGGVDDRDAFDGLIGRLTRHRELFRLIYAEGYRQDEAFTTLYPGRFRGHGLRSRCVRRGRREIRESLAGDRRRAT